MSTKVGSGVTYMLGALHHPLKYKGTEKAVIYKDKTDVKLF